MWLKLNGISVLTMGLGVLASACGSDDEEEGSNEPFAITSPAFADGQALPAEYTCDGKNFPYSGMPPVPHTSPQLNWTSGGANTQSYAVVFKDVTLTTATPVNELGYHWAIWNIPGSVRSLPKALGSGNPVPNLTGAQQVSGPLFDHGYIGPCPSWAVAPGAPPPAEGAPAPTVSNDSYTFTVFAFSSTLTAPAAPVEVPTPSGMNLSHVHALDDFFIANATAKVELRTTSNAQPAMFARPPAAN